MLTTIREISGNPCRDIIEGRVKLDPIRTVPVQAYAVKRSLALPLPSLKAVEPERKQGLTTGRDIDEVVDLFRQSQGMDKTFTTHQAAEFCLGMGWESFNATSNMGQRLTRMAARGEVRRIRMVGRIVYWRFL